MGVIYLILLFLLLILQGQSRTMVRPGKAWPELKNKNKPKSFRASRAAAEAASEDAGQSKLPLRG